MAMNNTGTMPTTQSPIKVVINNRNRLTTTRNMVEGLLGLNPDERIVIIDNGSTYPPLLEWYAAVSDRVETMFEANLGHSALWHLGLQATLGAYFVYTDSDIALDPEMPADWKQQMLNLIKKYEINKIGLSIRVDDLPDHYPYKEQAISDQAGCWTTEVESGVYRADTDTTFALYRNVGHNMYESLRVARTGFKSRHAPFYLDFNNLDQEELFVLQNHDTRFNTQYTKVHQKKINT